MNKDQAVSDIEGIFNQYLTVMPAEKTLLKALSDGKLYEVFVLAHVLEQIKAAGFRISFVGSSLKFKAAPGQIKKSDPHFEVRRAPGGKPNFWVFVDIEFITLGASDGCVSDLSQKHEIDIVLVTTDNGYPRHCEIALGVECKTSSTFKKSILKEVLGVRREMGVLSSPGYTLLQAAGGTGLNKVGFSPRSEFWVAFTDPSGTNYSEGPEFYGISLLHLQP